MSLDPTIVHATAVAVAGKGILIRGASGAGKSALAIALIEDARNDTTLVADDRVVLETTHNHRLLASPPPALAGLIEVRGIGILRRPYLSSIAIGLVVDLLPAAECPRLPDDADRRTTIGRALLPRLALPIGLSDAGLRVRLALQEWTQ